MLKSCRHPQKLTAFERQISDTQMVGLYVGIARPGKRLHNYGKIHHFLWENSLFLWPCSIAM